MDRTDRSIQNVSLLTRIVLVAVVECKEQRAEELEVN
jgi:hypothetical protein